MSIPKFNMRGYLEKGLYKCSSSEFYERFCEGLGSIRENYIEVLEQLFAFAIRRGVASIIVGGSFVSSEPNPQDIDCIVIFPNDLCANMLPSEILVVENCELDIMFASENNKEFIYKLMNLFSLDKFNLSVGMVEIILDMSQDCSTWDDYEDYNSVEKLLDAREAYIRRHCIRGATKKKVLAVICNYEEYMGWFLNISPAISSAGWIYAPIYYSLKIEDGDMFIEIVKQRLIELHITYEVEISVFADGYGTYLLGEYLTDSNEKNYKIDFDNIVLSKSLLKADFNWNKLFDSRRVNLVINLLDKKNNAKVNEVLNKKIKKAITTEDTYKMGFSQKHYKILDISYDYQNKLLSEEFINNILPMFHISNVITENNNNEAWKHAGEILEENTIKQTNLADIVIK